MIAEFSEFLNNYIPLVVETFKRWGYSIYLLPGQDIFLRVTLVRSMSGKMGGGDKHFNFRVAVPEG